MRYTLACSLLLCLFPSLGSADNIDHLRLRWRQMLTGGVHLDTSLPQVRARLASIESTGRHNWSLLQKSADRQTLWIDLSRSNVSADISNTYFRLRDMAIAWATPGQALYQDPGLLLDTISGMEWMDSHRYNSGASEYDNWYDWEIGAPGNVVEIAILLHDELRADQLSRYTASVNRFDSDCRVMMVNTLSTGANLADKCRIAILNGILVRDSASIAFAVNSLRPLFTYVTSGDGFYKDGSFIQHRRHPYNGSYGFELISDVANLLYLLVGSEWDVTDPGRANVLNWVNDSFAPLIYRGAMMDMVRGRAISRSSSSDHVAGHNSIGTLLRITQFAASGDAQPLRSVIKRWLQDDTSRDFSFNLPLDLIAEAHRILNDNSIAPANPRSASHVYASMDRAVHFRPTWAAGIAMHSSRIYNYESIDGENLKGWHTGDGMTYLYNADLAQFSDSFWPTVDPQRLPGTTVIAGSTARQSQVSGSNAVGGTSLHGYSALMMQLQSDGGQMSARKSWFLFDDELVALGADIRSTAPNKTVETIIENRRVTAASTFTADLNGAWAHLAGSVLGADIGYFFPDGAHWQSAGETRSGAWRDINAGGPGAELTAEYRTLWFDHGVMPGGATYSYVLLPGKSAHETAVYAASPATQIVENDADVQAVTHAGLGIQAANFWTIGSKPVAGIRSDSIASVLVHRANGLLAIAVSDPTQANNGVIQIEIAMAASGVVSQDDGVTVERTTPTVQLSIRPGESHGRPFLVTLTSQ